MTKTTDLNRESAKTQRILFLFSPRLIDSAVQFVGLSSLARSISL